MVKLAILLVILLFVCLWAIIVCVNDNKHLRNDFDNLSSAYDKKLIELARLRADVAMNPLNATYVSLLKKRIANIEALRKRESDQHSIAMAKVNQRFDEMTTVYYSVCNSNRKLRDDNKKLQASVNAYQAWWVD